MAKMLVFKRKKKVEPAPVVAPRVDVHLAPALVSSNPVTLETSLASLNEVNTLSDTEVAQTEAAADTSVESLDLEGAGMDDFEGRLKEYMDIKEALDKLTTRKDGLRDDLRERTKENGQVDGKGNKFLNVIIDEQRFTVLVENRNSVRLDEAKAILLCRAKGLNQCLDVIEVLKESAFEDSVRAGDVSVDEVKGMTLISTSEAFKVFATTPEVAEG